MQNDETDDAIPIRLLPTDVEPYTGRMRDVIQVARQGEIIHKGFRLRDASEKEDYPPKLGERFYAQVVEEITNLRMWAESYVRLELNSLAYSDFMFIKNTLLKLYKTSDTVNMANDFAKHDNPEQKVLLEEGIFIMRSFYEDFLINVINVAYDEHLRKYGRTY